MATRSPLVLFLTAACGIAGAQSDIAQLLWPLPQSYVQGSTSMALAGASGFFLCAPNTSHPVLAAALVRFYGYIYPGQAPPAPPAWCTGAEAVVAPAGHGAAVLLSGVDVHVADAAAPLSLGVNETYVLTIGPGARA
jgi:hypothetical protein